MAHTGSTWSDRYVGAISADTRGFSVKLVVSGSALTCVRRLLVPDACMHVCFLFSVSSGSFEHGTFCETFHSEVAGWRKCEACGKVRTPACC